MGIALPMPIQMASTFAALALGFGVVVGTALSPELAGIIASPSPTQVAEAPPEAAAPLVAGGGGGGSPSGAPVGGSTVPSTTGSGTSGGGGGGGGKKKKKKKPAQPQTIGGIVLRANPVAQSYTISSGGSLLSIHSGSLPNVGEIVEVGTVQLINGTYTEKSGWTGKGPADEATFAGTVTYCADLEQPAAACDGSSPTDHYVYTVSSLGSSLLVSAPVPAGAAPPRVGDGVNVTVRFGAALNPVTPGSWASNPACTPAYDEEHGVPDPPLTPRALLQGTVTKTSTAPADKATVEAIVQTVCPGPDPTLVLSADDLREVDRDLIAITVPDGIDLAKLSPGQPVQADLGIAPGGALSLRGITSDKGVQGADDPTQGQGTLAGK